MSADCEQVEMDEGKEENETDETDEDVELSETCSEWSLNENRLIVQLKIGDRVSPDYAY